MKKLINLAVAVSGIFLLAGCFECPHCKHEHEAQEATHSHETTKNDAILSITKTEAFEQDVLKAEKPVVVKFWAPWCGGCMQMKPIFEEVVKDLGEKYKFVEINIDNTDKSITEKYGIQGIPAILFFNKGSKVGESVVGVVSKEELKASIEKTFGPGQQGEAPEADTPQHEHDDLHK